MPEPDRRAAVIAYAKEYDIYLTFFDPPEHFDAAILGVIVGFGQEPAVLYDERLVLLALVDQGMSEEEAEDWFAYNTLGSFLGAATPRFLTFGLK